MKVLQLKKTKERSVERKHHWVFSGALASKSDNIKEGELVELQSHTGKTLAFGHYGEKSIALRILHFGDSFDEKKFWYESLSKALKLREVLQLKDTNTLRLVHGEGDGLPGLIIDRYANTLVIQCHSQGMLNAVEMIQNTLIELLGEALSFVVKSTEKSAKKSDTALVQVLEGGMQFKVDVGAGQKTGFFIDQRENRFMLQQMAKGKSVLNVFSYTGGFSVAAIKGGAKEICSVDLSESAIKLCSANIELNTSKDTQVTHKEVLMDAFEFIKEDAMAYDIVVLDPPAFAKHLSAKKNALRAYQRLNESAMRKMKSGSVLFTFSCSQVVSKQDFHYALLNAAWNAGKSVKILRELGQAADHPVNLFHPETEYLKGLLLYID